MQNNRHVMAGSGQAACLKAHPALSRKVGLAAAAVLLAAVTLSAPAIAADQPVGINGAVNPAGTGTPPSGATQALTIGQDVVFRERVDTTASGQTQIVFLDESSMSVGPSSDVVIDEFVYDPRTNTGKLAMSATRGVFRYVGGKISKLEGGVTVDTPVASIGIRGGVAQWNLVNNQLGIVFLYGKQLVVTGRNGVTKTILLPGYGITVGPDGNPSDPYKVKGDFISAVSTALDGRPGGNGGAREIPTDQRVASSAVYANLQGTAVAAAGGPCRGAAGLRATADHLTVRCDTSIDPGDFQTTLQENSIIGRKFTPVSTNSPPMQNTTPTMPTMPTGTISTVTTGVITSPGLGSFAGPGLFNGIGLRPGGGSFAPR
jgi:hypothetical protein